MAQTGQTNQQPKDADGARTSIFGHELSSPTVLAVLCTVALSCHWGWETVVMYAPVFQGLGDALSLWFVNNHIHLLGYLVVALLYKPLQKTLAGRPVLLTALAADVVGTACLAATPAVAQAVPHWTGVLWSTGANLVLSVGVILFVFALFRALRALPVPTARASVLASTVLELLIYVFVSPLPTPVQTVLALCLPLGIYVSLRRFWVVSDQAASVGSKDTPAGVSASVPAVSPAGVSAVSPAGVPADAAAVEGPRRLPLRAMVALCLFAFSINFLKCVYCQGLPDQFAEGQSSLLALTALIAGLGCGVVFFAKKRFDMDAEGPVLAVLIAASLLLGLLDPSSSLLKGAITFASFFVYVMLMYVIALKTTAPCTSDWLRTTAWLFFANALGLSCGADVARLVLGVAPYYPTAFSAVMLGLSYCVFIAAVFVYRQQRLATRVSADGIGAGSDGGDGGVLGEPVAERAAGQAVGQAPAGAGQGDEPTGLASALDARCRELAQAHGLTERETDTLLLLVQGCNLPTIAQKLTVSPNTAKSHIAHVYQKLGVHSREQLFELLRLAG